MTPKVVWHKTDINPAPRSTCVYLIGSLRNPEVPEIAKALRAAGLEVVDDWFSAGPNADDIWQEYETQRGRSYVEALDGLHAGHVFDFDKRHLDRCDGAILVLPCGKSGHMEFGYARGQGKWGLILLEDPTTTTRARWDVMYKFASEVCTSVDDLVESAVNWGEVPF